MTDATTTQDKDAAKIGAILVAAAIAAPMMVGAEGRIATTAPDPIGIATAGYGHAGAPAGKTYSDAEIVQMAALDLAKAGSGIAPCLPPVLPDKVRAAFTDEAFNLGVGSFCKSSMSAKAKAGDLPGACASLSLYVYAGGHPLPGLIRRRAAERALCEAGVAEGASEPPVSVPEAPQTVTAQPPAKPSVWQRVKGWFA